MARLGTGAAVTLRFAGTILVVLAYLLATHLVSIAHGADPTTMPLAYLLALLAFGCVSAGAALLLHGRHLFDPVRVAERWARQTPERDRDEPTA